MKNLRKQPKFKVGDSVGDLKIERLTKHHGYDFCVCRCSCGQIVMIHETDLRVNGLETCRNCVDKQKIDQVNLHELVLYVRHEGAIPRGAQAIVSRLIKTPMVAKVEIEYCGKAVICRPGELEKTGIFF